MPTFQLIYVGAYSQGDTLMRYLRGAAAIDEDDPVIEAITARAALEMHVPGCEPPGNDIDWSVEFSDGHEGWMAINTKLFGVLKPEKVAAS